MRTKEIQTLILELAGRRDAATRPPLMKALLDAHLGKLTSDKRQLFPDEIEALSEICRLVDTEHDPEKAWERIHDIQSGHVFPQPRELEDLQLAVGYNLLRSTAAYINLKDGRAASGIVVEVAGRFLVATTAHSIPSHPVGHLSFVGNREAKIDQNVPPILRFGRDDDQGRDVAYLELDCEWVEQNLGKSGIPLSRIHPCGTGEQNCWTFVCGYPTEQIQIERLRRGAVELKKFTVQCYGNKVLNPAQWDVLSEESRSPSQAVDVFIPYPQDDDVVCYGALTADQLSEPFGMSGGGYWQKQARDQRTVWAAEDYCLIAIQSRWWGLGRYLQGTQVIHWLRLLLRHEQELRPALQSAFPSEDLSRHP
jgi:hypothetical protein